MGNGLPAAIDNCHSTRSIPVTISVTGCSTCKRVFLSYQLSSTITGIIARCTSKQKDKDRDRLHLHEEVLARLGVQDELDGARSDVIDGFGGCHGLSGEITLHLGAETGSGRFFDDLCTSSAL